MAEVCATHPARAATGRCARCVKATCSFCALDIDGVLYCSVLCFTETTLETKRRGRVAPPAPDPLSQIDFQLPSEPDASVILSSSDAEPGDDSSVLLRATDGIDPTETSILDLSKARREEPDESAIRPIDSDLKDPTSLLGMSWLHEPPGSETPLPMVLPSTRRLTILSSCVFHRDTPAALRCSKCGDAICTLCIGEEERGGFCAPRCRREIRRARLRALGILGAIAGLVLAVWGLHKPGAPTPVASPSAAAIAEPPNAEPLPKPEPEPAAVLVKETVPEPLPPPKPEPVKVEAPKLPEPPPVVEAPKPPPPPPPKAEPVKVEPKVEPKPKPEPKPEPKVEAPRPPPPPPPPPVKPEPTPLDRAILRARDWIRAATPEFCELAERAAAEPTAEELPALLKSIDRVERKLGLARGEYAAILSDAPNRPLFERRLAILDELLGALRDYRTRLAEGR